MAAQPGIVLRVLSLALPLAAISAVALPVLAREPAPPDARVRIIWPSNGQMIKGGKFWLRMGTSNIGVAPAGVQKPKTAHHHLLVDVADLPPLDQPIPNNSNHLHFGGGQTEVRIELPPGQHTLQLLMGDAEHVPLDPPLMSKKITVTVPE
jgi:hypothetical protein